MQVPKPSLPLRVVVDLDLEPDPQSWNRRQRGRSGSGEVRINAARWLTRASKLARAGGISKFDAHRSIQIEGVSRKRKAPASTSSPDDDEIPLNQLFIKEEAEEEG